MSRICILSRSSRKFLGSKVFLKIFTSYLRGRCGNRSIADWTSRIEIDSPAESSTSIMPPALAVVGVGASAIVSAALAFALASLN